MLQSVCSVIYCIFRACFFFLLTAGTCTVFDNKMIHTICVAVQYVMIHCTAEKKKEEKKEEGRGGNVNFVSARIIKKAMKRIIICLACNLNRYAQDLSQ